MSENILHTFQIENSRKMSEVCTWLYFACKRSDNVLTWSCQTLSVQSLDKYLCLKLRPAESQQYLGHYICSEGAAGVIVERPLSRWVDVKSCMKIHIAMNLYKCWVKIKIPNVALLVLKHSWVWYFTLLPCSDVLWSTFYALWSSYIKILMFLTKI